LPSDQPLNGTPLADAGATSWFTELATAVSVAGAGASCPLTLKTTPGWLDDR
jgi:hypothetical protein